MKIKRFAITAVMMSAITLAPQIPAAMPYWQPAVNTMTASAAENVVNVQVVDMMTGEPINGVNIKSNLGTWNTSKEPIYRLEGAFNYNSIELEILYAPDEYEFNQCYYVNTDTRTSNDFIIRLAKKDEEKNFKIGAQFTDNWDGSTLYDIPFNVYDASEKWFATVNLNEAAALPDGNYIIKADNDALEAAGVRIASADIVNDIPTTDCFKFSIEDGATDTTPVFNLEAIEDEIKPNAIFSCTSGNDGVELSGKIIEVKGDNFRKTTTHGMMYLPNGYYTASLEGKTFVFYIVNGKPDKELNFVQNTTKQKLSKAKIIVTDTKGQYIENIDVELLSNIYGSTSAKTVKKWNTYNYHEMTVEDLGGVYPYYYGVILSNVPENYIVEKIYPFTFDHEGENAEWVIELINRDDIKANSSKARVNVFDADTGESIRGIDVVVTDALSGRFLNRWNTSDFPERQLINLTNVFPNCYSVKLSSIPEKYSNSKTSYIFSFSEGGQDDEWAIGLTANDKTPKESSSAIIKVVDKETGEVIPDVGIFLNANVNGTAELVDKWTSTEWAEKQIDGLDNVYPSCYGISLDLVPDKYDYKDRYLFSFDKLGEKQEWTIELEPKENVSQKGSSAIIKVVDKETGEVIPDVGIFLNANVNGTAELVDKWTSTEWAEKQIDGLDNVYPSCYGISLDLVPDKYDYKDRYLFSFDKLGEIQEWTIELESKENVSQKGSTAIIKVVDKVTGEVIPDVGIEFNANVNGTGKFIDKWTTTEYAEKIFTGLDNVYPSCYGVTLNYVPVGYKYKDRYLFSFDKLGDKQEWTIELEPTWTEVYESMPDNEDDLNCVAVINIIDKRSGETVKDVEAELIGGVNATEKILGTWNTTSEPEKTYYGLQGIRPFCYGVRLKNVPEKYDFEDTYVFSFEESNTTGLWNIILSEKGDDGKVYYGDIAVIDSETYLPIPGIVIELVSTFGGKDTIIRSWKVTNNYSQKVAISSDIFPGPYTIRILNLPDEYVYDFPRTFIVNDDLDEFHIVERLEHTDKVSEPIKCKLYGKFKGAYEENSGVGEVTIFNEQKGRIGAYDLNDKFRLPDGNYTASIFVNCKGLACFSDEDIAFTVKNGKIDTELKYNIERWDFGDAGNGDANNDGEVSMADAVLIMQYIANPDKYGIDGEKPTHISETGAAFADVDGGGITNKDALLIQQYLLGFFKA